MVHVIGMSLAGLDEGEKNLFEGRKIWGSIVILSGKDFIELGSQVKTLWFTQECIVRFFVGLSIFHYVVIE